MKSLLEDNFVTRSLGIPQFSEYGTYDRAIYQTVLVG
jgi:hypothetical protein